MPPKRIGIEKDDYEPCITKQHTKTMKLENKIALVTGATSGIGKATALALSAAGAKVVFQVDANRKAKILQS